MESVFVGKVVNTHGIKGEFRIKSDFEFKSRVFSIGKNIYIDNVSYKIMSYRVHKGYDMITIEGFNNINDVLEFKGKNVFVNRADLNLNHDEYLLDDLIDASVLCSKEVLGKVVDYTVGENPLLKVQGEKYFYIPLKGQFIKCFNKDEKALYVEDSTKGLII